MQSTTERGSPQFSDSGLLQPKLSPKVATSKKFTFPAQQEKEVTFLICADPESKQVYTLDPESNLIVLEKHVDPQYLEKAKQAIEEFDYIMDNVNRNRQWMSCSEEVESYRRRKIPYHLLRKDSPQFPSYLNQSLLSQAFSQIDCIKLKVNIQQYKLLLNINRKDRDTDQMLQQPLDVNYDENQNDNDDDYEYENEQSFLMNNPNPTASADEPLAISAGLVTGADEVIKNIIREVNKQFGKKLQPKENHQFVLQIEGIKEYLLGNHPMLCYERVRNNLRGHKDMGVILTEILINEPSEQKFPPAFKRLESDIKRKSYKGPDYQAFLKVPILIWYPHTKLPVMASLKQSLSLVDPQQKENSYKYFQLLSKNLTKDHNRLNDNTIRSGECEFTFKFKLCGIENLKRIFIQDNEDLTDWKATNNGLNMPSYVTKGKLKHKEIVKGGKGKQQQQQVNLKLYKHKEKSDSAKYQENIAKGGESAKEGLDLSFLSHGPEGVRQLNHILPNQLSMELLPYHISVEISLYHGNIKLASQESKRIPFSIAPRWMQEISFGNKFTVSQMPKETRVCFNIHVYGEKTNDYQVIGCSAFMLFDHNGKMNTGLKNVNCWPFYEADQRCACHQEYQGLLPFDALQQSKSLGVKLVESLASHQFMTPQCMSSRKKETNLLNQKIAWEFARISIQLQTFEHEVVHSVRDSKCMEAMGYASSKQKLNIHPKTSELAKLQRLLNVDPLERLQYSEQDQQILMICRNHYKSLTSALQIFLYSINWADPEQVKEAHLMLQKWDPIRAEDALPLLDANRADEKVRAYAVERISTLSDEELALYMLQLTQTLLFETRHLSALSEMLLERALLNPKLIGQEMFWQMRSQMHIKIFQQRYGLLLDSLIMLGGSFREDIFKQMKLCKFLQRLAKEVQGKEFRVGTVHLQGKLKDMEITSTIDFALEGRLQGKKFEIENCRVIDSKKQPLWLCIKNNLEPEGSVHNIIKIMFKSGDDIRQDQLTLQMIRIMDKIWLEAGIDFRMNAYKVISTDDQVGMIEIVQDSETISKIHHKFGGLLGALKNNTIFEYLNQNQEDDQKLIKDNFLKSCAGYAVATYLLGVGDRHSGNIMLSKTGHLFHIDFGHILGNFKEKYGIKRERAKFVFTEEMAFVMGGRNGANFTAFQENCTKAYNLVRKHGNFLLNIFQLMLSAGLPQLQSAHDIEYLRTQLALKDSEQEATNRFKRAIMESLNCTSRRIDNLLHNMKRNNDH